MSLRITASTALSNMPRPTRLRSACNSTSCRSSSFFLEQTFNQPNRARRTNITGTQRYPRKAYYSVSRYLSMRRAVSGGAVHRRGKPTCAHSLAQPRKACRVSIGTAAPGKKGGCLVKGVRHADGDKTADTRHAPHAPRSWRRGRTSAAQSAPQLKKKRTRTRPTAKIE